MYQEVSSISNVCQIVIVISISKVCRFGRY